MKIKQIQSIINQAKKDWDPAFSNDFDELIYTESMLELILKNIKNIE